MPIYMKYPGITGTAKGKYKDWIVLESCQLGTSGGGVKMKSAVVTKDTDSASVHLFREALWGEAKKVTIDFVTSKESPYLSVELEKTLISSFNSNGGKPFMETLQLDFAKATFSQKPTSTAKNSKDSRSRALWSLATG